MLLSVSSLPWAARRSPWSPAQGQEWGQRREIATPSQSQPGAAWSCLPLPKPALLESPLAASSVPAGVTCKDPQLVPSAPGLEFAYKVTTDQRGSGC